VLSTDILETNLNRAYGREPIPVERDFEINELLDALEAASPEERADFCGRLGATHAPVLRAYAERMASFAVRERSVEPLRRALSALALGGFADDEREAIMILPLVYRSAELIDADPASLFAGVADPCDCAAVREEIEAFPGRSPEDRLLAAFGYVEGTDVDGFLYVRTW